MIPDVVKAMAKKLIENSCDSDWTVQGFGMMRYYISERFRLHIWNPALRVDGVSDIHTHPWKFRSYVLSGYIVNYVYSEVDPLLVGASPHNKQRIKCGEGGGLVDEPERVALSLNSVEAIRWGEFYDMDDPDKIHYTRYSPGAVTIIDRTFETDKDHAYVYWPCNESWVSAEPRPATSTEVHNTLKLALGGLTEPENSEVFS